MEYTNAKQNRNVEEEQIEAVFIPDGSDIVTTDEEEQVVECKDLIIKNLTQHSANILSKYYSPSELQALDSAFSSDQVTKIHSSILNMSNGAYSSIPRVCLGRKCPSKHACPFIQLGLSMERTIMGKKCPVEVMLVEEWRDQYNDVIKKNKLDPDNIIIRNYISDLIECDITNMRMSHYLGGQTSDGGGEITENVFLINPKTGEPEYQKTENIALSIKQFVSLRKDRAIQALVASPFWQKKFEPKGGQRDDLEINGDVLTKAKNIRKEMQLKEDNVPKDADYSLVDDKDNNMVI